MKRILRSYRHPHVQWYTVGAALLAATLIQLLAAVRL